MARRNSVNPSSATPRRALSSLVDRADMNNTPLPMRSPSLMSGSEQENHRPRTNKRKGVTHAPSSLPTPTSDDVQPPRPTKRRRTGEHASTAVSEQEEESEEEDEDEEEEDDEPPTPSSHGDAVVDVTEERINARRQSDTQARTPRRESSKTVRFYDPNQNEGERRELKRKSRALEREFIDNRDEYLRSGNAGLTRTIEQANDIFTAVKQTADATTDSRLMVSVSDIAHRKSAQLTLGDTAIGIDVDEFVSKCISFMSQGARDVQRTSLGSTQRRRQADDDDEENELGDVLDWTHLGRQACFPYNARPPVPGFLLGPLSVQKRVRAPTQRRARQRDDGRVETRPEALERQDLQAGDTNTVRHICGKIKARLLSHTARAEAAVTAAVDVATASEPQIAAACRAQRITTAGGPALFDFVVHPTSFAQTVENLFYVSFLIKEGEVGVEMDDAGTPALIVTTETGADARRRGNTRRQAVFGIDHRTWRDLVEAYDITESLIPSRADDVAAASAAVGARGWYS